MSAAELDQKAERGQMSAVWGLRVFATKHMDMALIVVSFVVARALRFGNISFTDSELLVALLYVVVYSFAASFLGLYTNKNLISISGIRTVFYTYLVAMAIISVGLTATHLADSFSRIWFFTGTVLSVLAIGGARLFLLNAVMRGWVKFPANRSVIVGTGTLGQELYERLSQDPYKSNEIVGFFQSGTLLEQESEKPLKVLGSLEDIEEKLEALRAAGNPIGRVFIALPSAFLKERKALLDSLASTQYNAFIVPDFSLDILESGKADDISGLPVIDISHSRLHGTKASVKLMLDFFSALLGVLLLSPLLLFIAIAIKLDSSGPILFSQRRYGIGGKEIRVHKFRTMNVMEDGDSIQQATEFDPRVTRFGKFLRSSSLDELPQLFNVLEGTMSIVGPRPHAVAHNEQYRELIGGYMARYRVKPGITGLAQVSGCRGEILNLEDMERRVKYDREYLSSWSIGLDIAITLRTIGQVLSGAKAY